MGISRRGFIAGLGALIAAPAIVRASSLMPVKALPAGSSCLSLYAELCDVTRKAFVPRLFIQLYAASPALAYLTGQFDSADLARPALPENPPLSLLARDKREALLRSPRQHLTGSRYSRLIDQQPIAAHDSFAIA